MMHMVHKTQLGDLGLDTGLQYAAFTKCYNIARTCFNIQNTETIV